MFEELNIEDAELVLVAFGSVARILKSCVYTAREKGIKLGLFRPVTLYPFPTRQLEKLSHQIKNFMAIELNTGQMVEDLRLAVEKHGAVVDFYGRPPGSIPSPDELYREVIKIVKKRIKSS
jgi:2-oxoglutarate ferredoxin oxidoreductase subunit alpha